MLKTENLNYASSSSLLHYLRVCFTRLGQNQNRVSLSFLGQNQNRSNPRLSFQLNMSHQSIFNHGSRSLNRLRYVCKCDLNVLLMTTWTDANPYRHFYGCGMYRVCISFSIYVYRFKVNTLDMVQHLFIFISIDAFVWLDKEMNHREK